MSEKDGGKHGRRAANAGQKEFSGKKQSAKEGTSARPTSTKEANARSHSVTTDREIDIKKMRDSGKRTSEGKQDKV